MPELPSPDFHDHGLSSTHAVSPGEYLWMFHRHNEIELNFLPRGRHSYTFAGRHVPLPTRSLSIFWAGFYHRCAERTPDRELFALSIPLDIFLSWGLPRKAFVHPLLHGEMLHESDPAAADGDEIAMRRWHADLHCAAPAEQPVRREALLFEVRARLMRLALNAGSIRAGNSVEPGGVGRMLQYISTHYRDPALTAADIARHAGFHPSHAAEVFKNSCGTSLMRYVNHQRVTHAQRLLATTGAKVLDIAMDAGFGSVSQFHAVFRGITGDSPREYAKAHGNSGV